MPQPLDTKGGGTSAQHASGNSDNPTLPNKPIPTGFCGKLNVLENLCIVGGFGEQVHSGCTTDATRDFW